MSDRRFEGSSNGFLSGENVWLDSKPLSSENFHLIFRISIEQLFLHRFLYLNSLNDQLKSQTNKQAKLVGESIYTQRNHKFSCKKYKYKFCSFVAQNLFEVREVFIKKKIFFFMKKFYETMIPTHPSLTDMRTKRGGSITDAMKPILALTVLSQVFQ